MFQSMRRVGATVLGLAALFGSLNGQAYAQRVPMVGAINPGFAPARGLSGFATASALANGGTGFGALGFGTVESERAADGHAQPANALFIFDYEKPNPRIVRAHLRTPKRI